jgi:hypothetical protein
MPCSTLHLIRCPTLPLPHGHASAAVGPETFATTGTIEARRPTVNASPAGPARECRRSNAPAAVMQVRPLSVSSGTAGSSPFGRSPFGPSEWF